MNIIRTGFNSDQNNFFTCFASLCSFFRIKYDFTDSSTGRSIYTRANSVSFIHCFCIKAGKKNLIYAIRVNKLNSSFFCNNSFFFHFNCNSDSCSSSSFTVSCLQYPEFAFFNRKFHILNIFVSEFKFFCDIYILFIKVRHFGFKFCNGFWGSDTCNNIFALSVS